MKEIMCIKCGKKGQSLGLPHMRDVCSNCFCTVTQKRVRKELRLKKLIKKHDRILFVNDLSMEHLVAEYLLKRILKDLPVEFYSRRFDFERHTLPDFLGSKKLKETMKKMKITKVILPWNMDDECVLFLSQLFSGEAFNRIGQDKVFVKMLLNVSSQEVGIYSKMKGLKPWNRNADHC